MTDHARICSYSITDKLRIYSNGQLVAEFTIDMFPALIGHMGAALFGKIKED